jgi:hypothetical protein
MTEEYSMVFWGTVKWPHDDTGFRPGRIKYRPGYVYLISGGDFWKIGKTRDLPTRMKYFGLHLPFDVSLIHYIPCFDYTWAERVLHHTFRAYRVNGEWFEFDVKAMFGFTLFARQIETGWTMAYDLEESERETHCNAEWWDIYRSIEHGSQADD